MPPCQAYFCIISRDREFCHISQAGRELLTSSDSPALASQSAGITGMNHRPRPKKITLNVNGDFSGGKKNEANIYYILSVFNLLCGFKFGNMMRR